MNRSMRRRGIGGKILWYRSMRHRRDRRRGIGGGGRGVITIMGGIPQALNGRMSRRTARRCLDDASGPLPGALCSGAANGHLGVK
jgi:hypothetical protein